MGMLNPGLYRQLREVFGGRNVKAHKEGDPGDFRKGKMGGDYRLIKNDDSAGEEYSCPCPFCEDSQQRLYFNHHWGTEDPHTKRRILWLCNCYNEGCTQDYSNRVALAKMILEDGVPLKLRAPDPNDVRGPVKVRLPGIIQSLEELGRQNIHHPAVEWCLSRGLSVPTLTHRYGVGYCVLANVSGGMADRRLVAPFYVRNGKIVKLAGWTSRLLFPDEDQPKWLHSVGAIGKVTYGIGEASQFRTIVVTEGPGDKWAVGPQAVAILGKKVPDTKAKAIAKAVERYGEKASIVILLDPDKSKDDVKHKRPHHSIRAARALRKLVKCPVIDVRLPQRTDPGDLGRQYIWNCIRREAKGQGVKIYNE